MFVLLVHARSRNLIPRNASQRSRPHCALRFYWLRRAVDEAPGPVSAADDFPSIDFPGMLKLTSVPAPAAWTERSVSYRSLGL